VQDKQNPGETSTASQARNDALGSMWCGWQHQLNQISQSVGKQRAAHGLCILALGKHPYLRAVLACCPRSMWKSRNEAARRSWR